MTGLAISRYGMSTGMFSLLAAPFTLIQLADAVSKLSVPLIGLYALSNVPVADAKHHSKPTGGKGGGDIFIDCINACDENGKDAHEVAKLFCYGMCGLISLFKKDK